MIQTSRIPWKAYFHEQLGRIVVHEDSQLAQVLDLHGRSTSAWLPARGLLEDFIRKKVQSICIQCLKTRGPISQSSRHFYAC